MADAILRSLQRQYLQGNLAAEEYLQQLRRHGVIVWDWLPPQGFIALPFGEQIAIFSQKWPISHLERELLEMRASGSETSPGGLIYQPGGDIRWMDTHPDAPGVGEALAEELVSLAFVYAGQSQIPWATQEEQIAELVGSIWYLIHILQFHGRL